jgi:hypothetical protein
MNKQLIKDSLGWGLALWLIGYILGFVFFFLVPKESIGWFIMPIGAAITIWVLLRIKIKDMNYYLALSLVWTAIAIIMDYFFIVKMLNSGMEYYKFDVYFYYASTFALPLIVSWCKLNK